MRTRELRASCLALCIALAHFGCDDRQGSGGLTGSLFVPDCVDGASRDFFLPRDRVGPGIVEHSI